MSYPVVSAVIGRLESAWLKHLLASFSEGQFQLRLWDGRRFPAETAHPNVPIVHVRDQITLWKLAFDPWYQFGEAYADGRIEVEGDLTEFLTQIYRTSQRPTPGSFHYPRTSWWHAPHRNSVTGSRDNIHHHYDLGNDFYRRWLDSDLLYSCAYFPTHSTTLEEAQQAKMELVCRKLRLQSGERVVEAGCGWGALAVYMAKHYGVTVRAFNISSEQLAYARDRADRERVADRVKFLRQDWRDIDQPCDAFVSVGMLEHVGFTNYPQLGRVIQRCLKPGGRGLLHAIGQAHPARLNPWIERRIFPGAYPPPLSQMVHLLEPYDLITLDVENLRPHYFETLRHWTERFEAAMPAIRARYGERFVRMWRLYLCGSTAAFESGALQLFQVLFAESDDKRLPWTREDLYRFNPVGASSGNILDPAAMAGAEI